MKYGFIKVAAGVPAVKVADVEYNVQQIESLIAQAEGKGVEMIVFPELCITGLYPQTQYHLGRGTASGGQWSALQLCSCHPARCHPRYCVQDLSA